MWTILAKLAALAELVILREYWVLHGTYIGIDCDTACKVDLYAWYGGKLGYTRYGPVSSSFLELEREINGRTLSRSYTPNTNLLETLAIQQSKSFEQCFDKIPSSKALPRESGLVPKTTPSMTRFAVEKDAFEQYILSNVSLETLLWSHPALSSHLFNSSLSKASHWTASPKFQVPAPKALISIQSRPTSMMLASNVAPQHIQKSPNNKTLPTCNLLEPLLAVPAPIPAPICINTRSSLSFTLKDMR